MKLSLNKAARHYKVSKSTLSEALNSGRISAAKDDRGRWEIDPSEMERVFPLSGPNEQEDRTPNPANFNHANGLPSDVQALRKEIALLQEQHERERVYFTDQISDLRSRLDAESEDRRKLTALLTHEQAQKPQDGPRKGLWSRLVG